MTEPVKGHNHDTESDTELDELRARLRETERELAEVKGRWDETKVRCAYCYAAHEAPATFEAIQAHISECPKHPMAAMRAERDAAIRERDEARLKTLEEQSRAFSAAWERDAATQRAEEAEARVKELEDHPPGIGDGDIQRLFRERDAAEAKLKKCMGEAVEVAEELVETRAVLRATREALEDAELRAESAEAALRVAREALAFVEYETERAFKVLPPEAQLREGDAAHASACAFRAWCCASEVLRGGPSLVERLGEPLRSQLLERAALAPKGGA